MRIPDYSYEGRIEMNQGHSGRNVLNLIRHLGITFILLASLLSALFAQSPNLAKKQAPKGKWLDKGLSPDKRADLLIEQMTLDEKIILVHGDDGTHGEAALAGWRWVRSWNPSPRNPRPPDDRWEIRRRQYWVARPLCDGIAFGPGECC